MINEIICPNCNKAFKIDDAGYADIIKQVRNKEFESELERRQIQFETEKQQAIMLAEAQLKNSLTEELNNYKQLTIQAQGALENERTRLKIKTESFETEKSLAISQAIQNITVERDRLSIELSTERTSKQNELKLLNITHENHVKDMILAKNQELSAKDEIIERYKDMKARLNTKMLGESLEQHCEIEFNMIRPTAFPNVYFQKDNDTSSETKGDYIFREIDQEGNEIISIMFEMKNESDDPKKRQKIESHLKKLDEDRTKKKCEYAVMVTLLEADNDLYNNGIVDVSYKYKKMYVIRPQFFIPMITVLRNAALNSADYKAQLAHAKNQNIDISKFEEKLQEFKKKFGFNAEHAGKKLQAAITEIDKTIVLLTKVKENLQGSEQHLILANKKVEGVNVKKLTKDNPTMIRKFQELNGTSNNPDEQA